MGASRTRGLPVLAIALCLVPPPASASLFQGTRENPLTSISALRCRFSVRTSVQWKDGKPDVRTEPSTAPLTISNIDVENGTAEVPGSQGPRFATVTLSEGSLFVMASTPGGLDVTTVFATESSPGTFKAVRAQHSYVFLTVPPFVEDPTVSQSYGECEPASRGTASERPEQRP